MARSVVSVEQIRQFKASFVSYGSNSEAVLGSFREKVASMLSDFEDKLDKLEDDMERKEDALDRCEWSHRNDDGDHCSSQRSAYYRAQARYSSCLSLVQEARNAIGEFDSKVENFQATKADLVSRASAGLDRVEELIADYSSGSVTQGTSSPGGQISIPSSKGPSGEIDTEASGMQSAIHISGGDQIAYVLPKGSGTDPIVIDPEAMAHKFDSLPPIQEPDPQTMRIAAAGIITLLAAGGLAVGSKEMLLQQKTDEIFQQQYGISRTELLIGSGPKQKEYVDAYNRINQGLQKEMVEIKKEEVSTKIQEAKQLLETEERRIAELHGEVTLYSTELVHDKKIEIENLERQLATLSDGKKRPVVPSGKTAIGGLSEAGLSFMMDGMSTKERFATVSNIIGSSNVALTGDSGKAYVFSKGDTDIFFVAHDGSSVDHFVRDTSEGVSFKGPSIEAKPNVAYSTSPDDLSKIKFGDGIKETGIKATYKDEGFQVTRKYFSISEDGSANAWGTEVKLGAEASAEVNATLKNMNIGGEASLAKAGAKASHITAPVVMNGKISQFEFGVSGNVNAGVSASVGVFSAEDGTRELGVKLPGGKIAAILDRPTISLDAFPESIRGHVQTVIPVKSDLFDSYAKAMRPGERPMI